MSNGLWRGASACATLFSFSQVAPILCAARCLRILRAPPILSSVRTYTHKHIISSQPASKVSRIPRSLSLDYWNIIRPTMTSRITNSTGLYIFENLFGWATPPSRESISFPPEESIVCHRFSQQAQSRAHVHGNECRSVSNYILIFEQQQEKKSLEAWEWKLDGQLTVAGLWPYIPIMFLGIFLFFFLLLFPSISYTATGRV